MPCVIFGVVEGYDVFRCDFHYYALECIYIGFGDAFKLFFWHAYERGTSFHNCKCLFVDIVAVYFCRTVDENASQWVWGINQHGNVIVSFNVLVFSALDKGYY